MSNGIFPIPQFNSVPAAAGAQGRTSLAARVRTRTRRNTLDEQLAGGADPDAGVELSLRAAQLLSPSGRSRLANALAEALGDARGPNLGAFRMETRRQHAAIRAGADDLLALVQRLRDERPVDIRGAAMAARLLNDGASPLHGDSAQDLRRALQATQVALDRTDPVVEDLAAAA